MFLQWAVAGLIRVSKNTFCLTLYWQFCICNLWHPEKDTKLVSFVFIQDQCFHNYRKLHPTYNTKEEGWLKWSHILRRNWLLKLFIEERIKERTEVTIRRRRRRIKPLDDRTEERRWSKLRQEALDRRLGRTQFAGGYGPVVSHTRKSKLHESPTFQGVPHTELSKDITWQRVWRTFNP